MCGETFLEGARCATSQALTLWDSPMEYGESNVMGRMGCTFPIGFKCDKGLATTTMLREKIKYILCRVSNNETGQYNIDLHSRILDNICLYSDLQI